MFKFFTTTAMEHIAQNVIKQYSDKLISGEPQEIPIEEIVEFHYGLIMRYANLSKKGHIHGITVFEKSIIPVYDNENCRYEGKVAKEGTIIIDNRLVVKNRLKRFRFTVAHELAHWIIHKEYYIHIDELASKTSGQSDDQTEHEADYLGAALLMPQGRVKVAHSRIKHRFKGPELIQNLAQIFNVSNQAMTIRLKQLGLIF